MRTHDELVIESIYSGAVILNEKSVFSKFFTPTQNADGSMDYDKVNKAMEIIHKNLGISADAKPIPFEQVSSTTGRLATGGDTRKQKIKSEFDPEGLGSGTQWGLRGGGIKKHEVLKEVLARGDGVVSINPDTGTVIFIKRKLTSPKTEPEERDLKHERGDRYQAWLFNKNGDYDGYWERPLTGGKYYGERQPRPEHRSNIYSYIDRHGMTYVIPNESWRGTPDRNIYDPDTERIGLQSRDRETELNVNRYEDDEIVQPNDTPEVIAGKEQARKDRMKRENEAIVGGITKKTAHDEFEIGERGTRADTLAKTVLDKYGKYIQGRYNKALPAMKQKMKDTIDQGSASPEIMTTLMDELYLFQNAAEKGPDRKYLEDNIASFVTDNKENLTKYNADIQSRRMPSPSNPDRNVPVEIVNFNTEEGMRLFLRDLVKHMLKSVHGGRFEEKVYDQILDLF